jgi:hypothetical protein
VVGCHPVLRRFNAVAIAHYFLLVQAAATVGFARGLASRQSVLWKRFERTPPHARPSRLEPSTTPVVYTHE